LSNPHDGRGRVAVERTAFLRMKRTHQAQQDFAIRRTDRLEAR